MGILAEFREGERLGVGSVEVKLAVVLLDEVGSALADGVGGGHQVGTQDLHNAVSTYEKQLDSTTTHHGQDGHVGDTKVACAVDDQTRANNATKLLGQHGVGACKQDSS